MIKFFVKKDHLKNIEYYDDLANSSHYQDENENSGKD